jgi:diguanylate cyclase (GGDEF)-like protein
VLSGELSSTFVIDPFDDRDTRIGKTLSVYPREFDCRQALRRIVGARSLASHPTEKLAQASCFRGRGSFNSHLETQPAQMLQLSDLLAPAMTSDSSTRAGRDSDLCRGRASLFRNMRGAPKLQTDIEKLVLSTAAPAETLSEVADVICRHSRATVGLLARWEDEEQLATLLAHPGLTAPLADKLFASLAQYRAQCLRTARPFTVAAIDESILAGLPDELRALSLVRLHVLPLYKGGKPVGMLILARARGNFGAAAVRDIEQARATLVLLLEHVVYLEKISAYSNVANFDGLTGLFTHRYFQEALSKEIARAERLGYPISLMMIDIDHFKRYNDTFGHPHGDVALREIAGIIKRNIRSYDLAARYGGEELVLILPQVTPHRVVPVAERIRTSIAEFPFRGASENHRVQLTISVGVAGLPANAKTKSELIKRADQALYLAKEEGRNRVGVSLIRSRKSIRFAYCPPAFTSSYYADVLTGVRDVIEQVGGIELITRAPEKESDTRELLRICRSLVKGGIDAIALAPQSDAIVPIVRELKKARVPTFFFNVPRKIQGADVISYIGYHPNDAGQEVGRYLARVLRGSGSILVLTGLQDTSSLDRIDGFKAEITQYPRICVVATRQGAWERARSRKVVEQALRRHTIDAIFAVSDEMALGASDAVAAAGRRGEIFIVGLDGTRAALQAIREGALTATLNTNPREMGRILMRTVVRGLNRRQRVEPEIVSPINIVDLENVAHY